MDTNVVIAISTLVIAALTLFLMLHDKFSKGKCKIKSEAALLSKKGDRWRVYIRMNIYTKNKPITIRSVSLSKLYNKRRFAVCQFEKAYTGDAYAQAKNDYLLPNKIIQPFTYHRLILEATFKPELGLPEKYDWEENGWLLSFSYNQKSVIRKDLKMKILGRDKYLKELEAASIEINNNETQI